MPFDQGSYQPADAVLKCLQDAGQKVASRSHDWPCLWIAICDVTPTGEQMRERIAAIKYVARELGIPTACPNEQHHNGWIFILGSVYEFHDSHSIAENVALFDRAIEARRAELLAEQAST